MTGSPAPTPARDQFERHYEAKIWALIPEIYRNEDGTSHRPDQLRALVRILAAEAAVARRGIDRVLADTRIDEADDWAIPYIGALLGTRLLGSANPAGRRADVGHTIKYRRRAGTPHLLETLADDVADWDAVTAEAFRQLVRTWHMLDTAVPRGPVSRTPRGGFANLRTVRAMDVLDGPFDDFAHFPDLRRGAGRRGLYNIPDVNLFLYRQYAFPLSGVTPYKLDATRYTLDPSGRDVPLFQRGGETQQECASRNEWDVRAPITCRRLNAASYRLGDDPTQPPDWEPLVGRTFFTQHALLDATIGLPPMPPTFPDDLLRAALTPESPKAHLLARGATDRPSIDLAVGTNAASPSFEPHEVAGAGLLGWADTAVLDAWVHLLVDPARGRVRLTAAPVAPRKLLVRRVHYGIFFPVGAGSHDRRRTVPQPNPMPAPMGLSPNWSNIGGDILVGDSRTYSPSAAGGTVNVNADTRIWARDGSRPYVTLKRTGTQRTIHIAPAAGVKTLEINGLWLGVLLGNPPNPKDLAELVLQGNWDRVVLRDMTLDPGGERAALTGNAPTRIPHVRLVIEGVLDELVIERSVIGSIHERGLGGGSPCTAATIRISDSIVQGYPGQPAISVGSAMVDMDRSTVIGDCHCGRADISQSIIDGQLQVEDAQGSCFRFSTARSGGRIPAQYECAILPEGMPAGSFVSRRFGDPGYLQLAQACPHEVAAGAENGTEMGVFNRALAPIKAADLATKVQEYAPVQARVQLLVAT